MTIHDLHDRFQLIDHASALVQGTMTGAHRVEGTERSLQRAWPTSRSPLTKA